MRSQIFDLECFVQKLRGPDRVRDDSEASVESVWDL